MSTMKDTVKPVMKALALLMVVAAGNASAQWGMDPWAAQMAAYDQQMDAWVQQQMQQAQQQVDQSVANAQRFFIDYYRQHTGDYATPDHQAMQLGDALYCQHNPVQCQQNAEHAEAMMGIGAAGHAQRMDDTRAWGQTMQGIGQTNSGILDMSQQGYMDRQAAIGAGQAGFVQGSIHGEATFVGSGGGAGFSLPVYPDPNMSYSTPSGDPLAFDYNTGIWYQADASGWWYPLQQQR